MCSPQCGWYFHHAFFSGDVIFRFNRIDLGICLVTLALGGPIAYMVLLLQRSTRSEVEIYSTARVYGSVCKRSCGGSPITYIATSTVVNLQLFLE